jgi:hypothetical protein
MIPANCNTPKSAQWSELIFLGGRNRVTISSSVHPSEVEMPVLIAYAILQGTTKEQLEALVREAIGKGWQPIGGVAVSGNVFYQAMAGH